MSRSIDTLLVTSPGCHFCDDAHRLLTELAERVPLRIEEIALSSEQGRGLLVHHRVPFPPILTIDGEFFGYGRISRRKLEAHLMRLVARDQVG